MSDITISRPEVVTGHTDVICSTSIRHILAVRKSALLQIDTLIRQLAEISSMTESIGGKTSLDWAMKQDFRCGCWLMEKPETGKTSLFVWMVTSSPFRVKSAMKTRCSSLNTLRRDLHTSLSKGWN